MRGLTAAIAILVMTGVVPVSAEEAQNVGGTWTGVSIVKQRNTTAQDDFTLMLKQDGQAVTGTWSLKQGGSGKRGGRTSEDIPAKGTLAGDKLSLKIGKERWLEATVNGDSMSGKTASGNGAAGDLTATRAK